MKQIKKGPCINKANSLHTVGRTQRPLHMQSLMMLRDLSLLTITNSCSVYTVKETIFQLTYTWTQDRRIFTPNYTPTSKSDNLYTEMYDT